MRCRRANLGTAFNAGHGRRAQTGARTDQAGRRPQAEFALEDATALLVLRQRVGATPERAQHAYQLGVAALVQRVLRDQRAGKGERLLGAVAMALDERGQDLLMAVARRLALGHAPLGGGIAGRQVEPFEKLAAKQAAGLDQRLAAHADERASRQALEPGQIGGHRVAAQLDRLAVGAQDWAAVLAQRAPNLRQAPTQPRARIGGVLPEQCAEFAAQLSPGRDGQIGQQRPRLAGGGQRQRLHDPAHLQLAEQTNLQARIRRSFGRGEQGEILLVVAPDLAFAH